MATEEINCVIYPEKGEVEIDGAIVLLRPKTFELLLFLATNSGQTLSKKEILAKVWPNSVVEEQVIFQSINEIRKQAGLSGAIKTYPRRGYCWVLENTSIKSAESDDKNDSTQLVEKNNATFIRTVTLLVTIICVTFLYFGINWRPSDISQSAEQVLQKKVHQGVLILPFDVENLDESQKWLRFGAMEGLIKRIAPNQNMTVFQLEDTIEILNRLSASDKENTDKIFGKSGASYILKTSISGVPGDYNLIYSFYTVNSVTTKTIHTTDVNRGLTKLAQVFEQPITNNSQIDTQALNEKFQNDLIIKAIQFLEIDDKKSALAFLETAVINDASNIFAQYLLSKVALESGNYQKALETINMALSYKHSPALARYKNRLLFYKGGALIMNKSLTAAEETLLAAEKLSKENKDWLYYSYSQSMLGKINQFKNEVDKADSYFMSALQYQEMLQCPMGIAQAHIDLADLYLFNKQRQKALASYQIAAALISEQQLSQAEPLLSPIKEKLLQTSAN